MHCRIPTIALVMFFASIHTAAAEDSFPRGRLPDTVTPERYTLTFNIDPRQPQFTAHRRHCDPRQSRHAAHLAARQRTDRLERLYRGRRPQATRQVSTGRPDQRCRAAGCRRGSARRDRPRYTSRTKVAFARARKASSARKPARTGTCSRRWSRSMRVAHFPGFDEPRFKTPIRDHDHHTGGR